MMSVPNPLGRARNRADGRAVGWARAAALVLAACLALSGCAAKTPTATDNLARETWAKFRASGKTPWKPFSIQASLNFAAPGKSHRVLLKLWGDPNYPLRLDFTAGIGQTFALWREDGSGWLAYYPMSAAAYTHPDTRKGAGVLGMPLPFSLRELSAVLCGRFGEFIPGDYRSVKAKPGGLEFSFSGDPRLASVTLDELGRPLAVAGKGVEPWSVEFADYQDAGGRELPHMITLTTPGGLKGVVRVKKYEQRDEPWPAEALALRLPERTVVYALDVMADFKRPDLGGGQ